jgi:predicted porin
LAVRGGLAAPLLGDFNVKRTFISAAAILAFTAAGHADELSDIQAQAKQLRDQNQALMKRLSDIEKRQKALETQAAQKPAAVVNPVDAMAADLPYKAVVKAPAPINDDLCWHGVCLYGNFDMGVSYVQHGNPFNAFAGGPQQYVVEKASNGSQFGVGANQMSTSFLGLRGKQEIGDNLYAVFNLQTLFNPASGMNANGMGAIVQNNGLGAVPTLGNLANAYGDSSKAGQMFNNVAYFGVSSPLYGTFTMGRQSALTSDLVVNYDALSGSNAWSLITFEGATGGGGVTENRIFDNSYEYRWNYGGPNFGLRFAAEAQLRNGGNSTTGNAFEGDVGFDYLGFSMDFVGGKIFDANSVGTTLNTTQVNQLTSNQTGSPTNLGTGAALNGPGYAIPCSLGCLSGVISDNTVFSVGAKYTLGPWKLYGGYEHLNFANPNNPMQPGAFSAGGYNVAFVNNNNYATDRNQHIFWAGVRYSVTPTFDVIGAYYGIRQEYFTVGAGPGVAGNQTFASIPGHGLAAVPAGFTSQAAACASNGASSSGCAGAVDMFSLALDWRFARHMDFYAGVSYSQKTGGLANAYVLSNNNGTITNPALFNNRVSNYDPGVGLRYQF